MDIDGDQETDLLLIGAQQYFTETRGGRVYAYGWEEVRHENGQGNTHPTHLREAHIVS